MTRNLISIETHKEPEHHHYPIKMRDMYHSTKKITDEQVYEAAHFFSANYGIWGPSAVENMGAAIKAGKQVTIS